MTTQDNERLYLDDLCKRWRKDADQIVEMAIAGEVGLWLAFSNVFLRQEGATGGTRRKKPPAPQLHEQVEVKPRPEVLAQLRGRCDRMLIAAELSCLDGNNKPVAITNAVGEEWGETSMIGLKPAALFARPEDISKFERKNKIVPHIVHVEHHDLKGPVAEATLSVPATDHPCFAPELHAAGACWNALFALARTTATGAKKADILAWLRQHHPELSRAAMERIALVVTPTKGGRRSAN